MIPKVMSGVQLLRHGGPEALVWSDAIPVPVPGPGQVLVRVAAAGVNNTDINTRIGWYAPEVTGATDAPLDGVDAGGWGGALSFPRIQGGDLCGYVVARGLGATRFSEGARVTCPINLPRPSAETPFAFIALGSEIDGAFADYCCLEENDLYDVTASPLSDEEIAAMPCAFGTAENLVCQVGVAAGDRVLVSGASGGVGMAAVALAKSRGARVTGIASPRKAEFVRKAGADEVIGRDEPPTAQAFDRVLDVVGGPGWGGLIEALRPGGCYAVSGAIAGPIVQVDLRTIYLRDLTIFGATYQSPEVFAGLVDQINVGEIRPLIAKTYPLREIARAQEDFMSKELAGKLVLIPGGRA